MQTVTLNNGIKMPILGYGVFKIDNAIAAQCVQDAIRAGYRSIDTAMIYGNESGVGEGIRAGGIDRKELFIATKLWNNDQGYDSARRAFDDSLTRLGLDYVDLYLIHWPVPKKGLYVETWKALEAIYKEGRARAIGVSNFTIRHLEDLAQHCQVVPVLNQIELHPWLNQSELRAYMAQKGIYAEAWSPLARGRHLDNPVLGEIAAKYGKAASQVILRWDIQHGIITIPKSTHFERMQNNADIFDFSLTDAEMQAIDALDCGERIGPNPDLFEG